MIEMPEDKLREFIASKDADEVATEDYVIDDTGEYVWQVGQKASQSRFHPTSEENQPKMVRSTSYEDFEEPSDPLDALQDLVDQFVDENSEFEPGLGSGTDIAFDIADNFFHFYPEWKELAVDAGMSKDELKGLIADRLHDRYAHMESHEDQD